MFTVEPEIATVSITLSGQDPVLVKEVTQSLRRLLGNGFVLTDGPVEESGTVEVGCELRIATTRARPKFRVIRNPFDLKR